MLFYVVSGFQGNGVGKTVAGKRYRERDNVDVPN